mmetsp:Transcript_4320/g.11720  ORF Transcript_4320/g.11720 Transcript_4320/m.11720 type:complete len:502 (+) Transcript_4320:2382-3887(+)
MHSDHRLRGQGPEQRLHHPFGHRGCEGRLRHPGVADDLQRRLLDHRRRRRHQRAGAGLPSQLSAQSARELPSDFLRNAEQHESRRRGPVCAGAPLQGEDQVHLRRGLRPAGRPGGREGVRGRVPLQRADHLPDEGLAREGRAPQDHGGGRPGQGPRSGSGGPGAARLRARDLRDAQEALRRPVQRDEELQLRHGGGRQVRHGLLHQRERQPGEPPDRVRVPGHRRVHGQSDQRRHRQQEVPEDPVPGAPEHPAHHPRAAGRDEVRRGDPLHDGPWLLHARPARAGRHLHVQVRCGRGVRRPLRRQRPGYRADRLRPVHPARALLVRRRLHQVRRRSDCLPSPHRLQHRRHPQAGRQKQHPVRYQVPGLRSVERAVHLPEDQVRHVPGRQQRADDDLRVRPVDDSARAAEASRPHRAQVAQVRVLSGDARRPDPAVRGAQGCAPRVRRPVRRHGGVHVRGGLQGRLRRRTHGAGAARGGLDRRSHQVPDEVRGLRRLLHRRR